MSRYILGIDQSTSGTKALLFDESGDLSSRHDLPHRQIISDNGWVEHDPAEIYNNTIEAVKGVVLKADIDKASIIGIGISNQRETAMVWDKSTGLPVYNAVVWQCARGEVICEKLRERGVSDSIREITGLHLSPYFSAAKIAWILQNIDTKGKQLCAGTMDSWLLYKLTGQFKTDYSNASRTQMFDLTSLKWSEEVCGMFDIDTGILAEVCDSNADFGMTDFGGFLDTPIPVHGVMGDSHGALFGQGCRAPGSIKATYGTGSSVMMNIGDTPIFSDKGVVTSIGWGIDGKIDYVLEGNINYTGAVMKWIVEDLGLIESPKLAAEYAIKAGADDETYLVPAFSGLGAPYWNSKARAVLCGMSRTTGKAEIVKAAEECIAYQIADIINAMCDTAGISGESLRVDGGSTRDRYLMQFQSDILNLSVLVPEIEELSGMGPAYAAGIALGCYDKDEIFSRIARSEFLPVMGENIRTKKINGWKAALQMTIGNQHV